MLPRDLRRKLGQIARGEEVTPSSPQPETESGTPESPSPDASAPGAHSASTHSPICHAAVPADYFPEILGSAATNRGGEFFRIEYPASRLVCGTEAIRDPFTQLAARSGLQSAEYCFLDIETTGLSSTRPVFLVGLLGYFTDELRVTQLFARDYSEEPALLAELNEILRPCKKLVTFNGRIFDVPYLRDRAVFHRTPLIFPPDHLDLLAVARMTWRGRFRDCRLQTLEEHLCGRRRLEDTPGHLIPELYHTFVRSGDWLPLRGVFFHNALDLLTMAELIIR